MPYLTIPYYIILYHTILYHTIPYHATPCYTMRYNTILYHTIPCHLLPSLPFYSFAFTPCSYPPSSRPISPQSWLSSCYSQCYIYYTLPHYIILHHTIPYHTMLSYTIPSHPIPYYTPLHPLSYPFLYRPTPSCSLPTFLFHPLFPLLISTIRPTNQLRALPIFLLFTILYTIPYHTTLDYTIHHHPIHAIPY